ncbi:CGNR zinc finger domain-containing protein [Streptomyces sp. NPDC048639]|uniref:CGNR zinc finger domain-containing protein n=1 Tax=Streptomyces sp. NPDC048639 TaxID=3365581 RepID=UPI00370F8035
MGDLLALELAATIRHDGHGGVADDLETVDALARWLRGKDERLRRILDVGPTTADGPRTADEETLCAVREVRSAVRALFARAVAPRPPSRADSADLPPTAIALDVLATAAARVPSAPRLDWPEGGRPVVVGIAPPAPPSADLLPATLARAAIDFLAGEDRTRLRACPAPRCARYFVKEHPRQEWCGPACGNRARVARHHRRHRAGETEPA